MKRHSRKILNLLFVILMLHMGSFIDSAWAQPFSTLKLDPDRVPWTDLLFEGKNFFVGVIIEVQLASFPATPLEASLLTSPQGIPVKTGGPTINRVTVNTTIDPLFGSTVTLRNQVWFDPKTAGALQRIRLRRGQDDFEKTCRFTMEGVYRLRKEPAGKKEFSLAPEQWTDVKESFYPYDLDQTGCVSASESSIIPYILAAGRLSQDSGAMNLCAFHKKLLHYVQIVPDGLQQLQVDYTERLQETEVHKEALVDVLKISLHARPLNTLVDEDEAFSFLGLMGDIELYMDIHSRVPVRISGEIPTFGRADFWLKEVKLRQKAD